jgi:RNA polymerase sigma-70 factor (ECF subfamily)
VEQDDVQLILATRRGQQSAYGQLVRRYQDRLFTSLVHVCGSREEAEDVAQEAFVQAYLKLGSFEGQSSFYTWLYRIAFNAAISRRRRQRGDLSVERGRELSGGEPTDSSEGAEEQLLRQERAGLVQQALAQLNHEHRIVLVLREMDGCDYEAIAQILDLPIGTVRSRLHRARIQLKEHLSAILGEPREG